MSMCPDIWNVLHDGTVVAVVGRVPGNLRIDIEADYLRSRFTDHGSRFVITLQDCRTCEFQQWSSPEHLVTDLHEIAGLQLWILSADVTENVCIVHCTQGDNGGTLRVPARDAALALDSGRTLTLEEISAWPMHTGPSLHQASLMTDRSWPDPQPMVVVAVSQASAAGEPRATDSKSMRTRPATG
jgi:hypothetical protein